MINIYDGALKLSKSKLYMSPYKKSVDQVWKILKNYKIINQINFLKNLITLEIEYVNDDKNEKLSSSALGMYYDYFNKIYLKDNSSFETLNHELFHVASRGRKSGGGIKNIFIGTNLNEGITEYLTLKSLNKKSNNSGYQMELFVIECLVFIYGEQILEPYFDNKSKIFFNQFQQFGIYGDVLIELDRILNKMSSSIKWNISRLSCLIFYDLFPNIIQEDMNYFKNISLEMNCGSLANVFLDKYKNELKKECDLKKIFEINVFEYQYRDLKKKEIANAYIVEYYEFMKKNFIKILDLLIMMARAQNILMENMCDFIDESLGYKAADFKEMYAEIIYEKLNLQEKKR